MDKQERKPGGRGPTGKRQPGAGMPATDTDRMPGGAGAGDGRAGPGAMGTGGAGGGAPAPLGNGTRDEPIWGS